MSANSSSENSHPQEIRSSFQQHLISVWEKDESFIDHYWENNSSEILKAVKKFEIKKCELVQGGREEYLGGNYQQAIDYCTKALSVSPRLAEAYLCRGAAYCSIGEFKSAVRDFKTYLEINPDDDQARLKLGKIYCKWGIALSVMGDTKDAFSKFKKALKINPDNVAVYVVRGQVYREMGKHFKALSDFKKAIALIPDDPDILFLMGQTFMEIGRYWFAIQSFEKALAIDPDFAASHGFEMEAFEKLQRYIKSGSFPTRETLLGRNRKCDWVFTDDRISRTHAGIYQVRDKVILVDLGSSNGTFIGQQKARILPYTPIQIKPGSIIHLARKHKLDLSQLYYLGYEEFGG